VAHDTSYAARVRARATALFPFVIAVVLPPAGLILGIVGVLQVDRGLGTRLIVVALCAAAVWAFLVTA
jgi:hypothetical protein